MPLEIESPMQAGAPRPSSVSPARCLRIGLINNMPDPALTGTEAQFATLLAAAAAADGREVRLCYSHLPEVPRGAAALESIARRYWPLEDLLASELDGLIVTGAEPRAAALPEEPYWARFVEVLDHARRYVPSSLWSCLAAHGAVLHLDGLARRRLAQKRSGVFDHDVHADHPLVSGLEGSIAVPHSRWNDLDPSGLRAAGYVVLTESVHTGVDTFVRTGTHPMVFCQGHPEYDALALLKEYRRDVGRFLEGTQAHYPPVPAGYLDADAIALLAAFEEKVGATGSPARMAEFPYTEVASTVVNRWQAPGVRLYRNWFSLIEASRESPRAG